MKLVWSQEAKADFERIYYFIGNHDAAIILIGEIRKEANILLTFPRSGRPDIDHPGAHRFLVGKYELIYEIGDKDISVLRVWHTRESRPR